MGLRIRPQALLLELGIYGSSTDAVPLSFKCLEGRYHPFPAPPRLKNSLCLCSLGIVPALFPEEEKESILSQIGQEALKQGTSPAKESVWQYFVNKSANNLHIVLGMSPVGDTLRTRCRNFPGAPELSLQMGFSPSAGHSQQSETGDGHWAEIRALQRRVRPALPLAIAGGLSCCPRWTVSSNNEEMLTGPGARPEASSLLSSI